MNFGSSGGGGSGLGSGAGPVGSQNADSIIQQTEMALQMQQVVLVKFCRFAQISQKLKVYN